MVVARLMVALALAGGCAGPAPAPGGAVEGSEPLVRPGEYLLRVAGAPLSGTIDELLDAVEGQLVRGYELLPGLYHVRSPRALAELRRTLGDRVESVRPNRLMFATGGGGPQGVAPTLPNDPDFWRQWSLRNVGQVFESSAGLSGTSGADIGASDGWGRGTGSRVVVAVLDSGVYAQHQDLAGRLWVNRAEAGGLPGVDDDANGYADDLSGWNFVPQTKTPGSTLPGSPDTSDLSGHGTAVASILGAAGNDGIGMCGVAWNVRIMPLAVFHFENGKLVTDVASAIAALEYAVKNGARISSSSWGGYVGAGDASDFVDLELAIAKAGEQGHLFVASAGNGTGNVGTDNDQQPFFPASFDLGNVLSVTGTDYDDALPSSFNWGRTSVDLAAPAVQIYTAAVAAPTAYQYAAAGTSYATPQVAAAAALFLGRAGTPGYRAVRSSLISSARAVPALAGKVSSGGVLDLGRLMELLPDASSETRPVEAAQPR